MPEVYDITDDDVEVAEAPRGKARANGGESGTGKGETTAPATTTKGGETQASGRPLSPRQNSHGNSRNSPPLEDVHMRAVDEEEEAEDERTGFGGR